MPPLEKVTVQAAAKINLLLYILGPAPGGYHRILSFIQMVDLQDRLTLSRQPKHSGIRLVVRGRPVPRGMDNLVVQAARSFINRYGIEDGLRIELEKRIPLGAGLGGGSSDAAAVLRGLGHLFSRKPPLAQLMKLGGRLGSDVPFFFRGPAAWVTGRGEAVFPTKSVRSGWIVLINPGFAVSTAWAYKEFDRLQRDRTQDRMTFLTKMGLTSEPDRLKIHFRAPKALPLTKRSFSLHNDLEAITIRRYPVIATIKEQLYSLGASKALMSGSGPTVFGLFPDRPAAEQAAAGLRHRSGRLKGRQDWAIWVVRLLGRLPNENK